MSSNPDDYDAVVEACIKAAELINEHGSNDLQLAINIVLFILGREIARQGRHDLTPPRFSSVDGEEESD